MVERQKKIDTIRIVLGVIGLAGILAIAAVAPNAIQSLTLFGIGKTKYNRKRYLNAVVDRLEKKGLVKLVRNSQGVLCVRLTKRGKAELQKYELGTLTLPRPKRWDGKYRIIIFDIKEWKRKTRDELRAWLEQLGFIRLQNSVWVYPHECQETISLLKAHFQIGKEVLYITADTIENDRWLRREFGLPAVSSV